MFFSSRKAASAIAALASMGAASLFLGAAPASAATAECGVGATLIPGNICEQTFTSGTATFTPTVAMSQLEVLLVAGGGDGADKTSSNGYSAGGGGGQVKLVGFGASTPKELTLVVGGARTASTVFDGTTTTTAEPGVSASLDGLVGGASGSGNAGATGTYANPTAPFGAGGGAGASPVANTDGGAGVVVSTLAAAGSVFSTDDDCYGGGGAVGDGTVAGIATCGGGQPAATTPVSLVAPTPNSGGGGGGITLTAPLDVRGGASGLVVVRWIPLVTVNFVDNGHGAAVPPQTFVAGGLPAKPADPTETGWLFTGWFTDAALTIPADFTAPVTESTTYYAGWSPVLAATGSAATGTVIPLGIALLALGGAAIGLTRRQRTRAN